MTLSSAELPSEVWLRGNLRPVWALVGATLAAGAVLGILALPPVSAPIARPIALGFALVAGPLVAVLACVAARPRLARRGGMLRVRLAPLAAHDVPIDHVECFFLGSHALADPDGRDDRPTQRVGTLVMRIAERATAWSTRPTFASWGEWTEGAVVFDGRWCEPLSVELARRLSARLVEAKRAATGEPR